MTRVGRERNGGFGAIDGEKRTLIDSEDEWLPAVYGRSRLCEVLAAILMPV
jgi:hypothetical protein